MTGAIGVGLGAAIGGEASYAETIGSLVGLWAGLIPGTIFVCRMRETGNLVADLGLAFRFPADLIGVLVGLLFQFLLLPVLYAVIQLFVEHDLSEDLAEPAEDLTGSAHGTGFFVLAVLLIVGAPLVEEIFYRGLLLRSLKRHMPAAVAIVVCGVIFGAVHFSVITLPGLAVFGMALSWLAHRWGRLGPNIVAHAAFNAVTVVALWNA